MTVSELPAAPVATEHSIATSQGTLHACCWQPPGGERGVPIVLLHDSLGSVALWRGFPAALCAATGRAVIAYDRAGFGRSAARSERLGRDFIAQEAVTGFAAVLAHFGLERWVVFGHSVGGGMAVHCAARWPGQCVAVITAAAQAFVEDRTIAGIEEARTLFADADQRARLARYHGERTDWVLEAWIGSWLAPDFADWSLRAVLPQLACPLLALHGELDEYGSAAHPMLIAELAGGAVERHLLASIGHVPHREDEALVLQLVTAFLATLA